MSCKTKECVVCGEKTDKYEIDEKGRIICHSCVYRLIGF